MKNNIYKKIYVGVFAFILSFPIFGQLFMKPDLSAEARVLTPKPEWEAVQSLSDYEDYYVDRIAGRRYLIEASSLIDYYLFKRSITPNVLIGKNDQLFYVGENQVLYSADDASGSDQMIVSQEQIDAIVQVQNDIQTEMDKRNITYLIVIPPDKQSIYTSDLPDYYQKNRESPSAKDIIISALREQTNVEILDLRLAIQEETTIRDTFLSTDSHWNYDGSFIGYQEIIRHLRKEYADLPLMERSDFQIEHIELNGQNLANMLNLGHRLFDKAGVKYTPEMPGEIIDTPRDYPDTNRASPEFRMITTQQPSRPDLPNIVMYRDSFAGLDGYPIGNLNRFICCSAYNFASYSHPQIDFNYIDTEKADIVIFEVLESNILYLGINYLNNGESESDKPLYSFEF